MPVFTASFGVAHSSCSTPLEGVVKAADAALYRAKAAGRDRVVVDENTALVPWDTDGETAEDDREIAPTLAGFAALADHDDPLDP